MVTQKLEQLYRLYLNSLEALAFQQHVHGVSFEDFPNHYVLVFYLTSTQQTSHDYLYPEFTNGSISISLRFSTQLTDSKELFFLGNKTSRKYNDSSRKVSQEIPLSSNIESKKILMNWNCGDSSINISI